MKHPEKNGVVSGAMLIEKTVQMNTFEIVKYQLMHYCVVNDLDINQTELKCLAFLGVMGKVRLTEFSKEAVRRGILGSPNAITNYISRLEKQGFVLSEGLGKKKICLDPKLGIFSDGNIVIKINLIKIGKPANTSATVQAGGRETQPA